MYVVRVWDALGSLVKTRVFSTLEDMERFTLGLPGYVSWTVSVEK